MIYVELSDIELKPNEKVVKTIYRFSENQDMSNPYIYETTKPNELYGLSLDKLPNYEIKKDRDYYVDARYIVEPGGMQRISSVKQFRLKYNNELNGLMDGLYRYPAPKVSVMNGYKGEHTLFRILVNVGDTTRLESIDVIITDVIDGSDVYIRNVKNRQELNFTKFLKGNRRYLIRASAISKSGLTSPFGLLEINTAPYNYPNLDIYREKISFRNQGNDVIEFRRKPDTVNIEIYDNENILLTSYSSSDDEVLIPQLPVDTYKIKIIGDNNEYIWVYSSESANSDFIPDWLPQPLPYKLRKD